MVAGSTCVKKKEKGSSSKKGSNSNNNQLVNLNMNINKEISTAFEQFSNNIAQIEENPHSLLKGIFHLSQFVFCESDNKNLFLN